MSSHRNGGELSGKHRRPHLNPCPTDVVRLSHRHASTLYIGGVRGEKLSRLSQDHPRVEQSTEHRLHYAQGPKRPGQSSRASGSGGAKNRKPSRPVRSIPRQNHPLRPDTGRSQLARRPDRVRGVHGQERVDGREERGTRAMDGISQSAVYRRHGGAGRRVRLRPRADGD